MANIFHSIFTIISIMLATTQSGLDHLRQVYPSAYQDAAACKDQIETFKNKKASNPIELAYQGAYYMTWAKHLSTPLRKLNSFKKGKKLMDEAFKSGNGEPEIHFLRLTIQYNAPSILGYDKNIQEDLELVLAKFDKIESPRLKKNIRTFLAGTDLLSDEQKRRFNHVN